MFILQVPFDAFRAELTQVEGEVFPGLESDYFVVFDFELDSALLTAKTAMCFDDAVRVANWSPTQGRGGAHMRTEPVNELRDWGRDLRHFNSYQELRRPWHRAKAHPGSMQDSCDDTGGIRSGNGARVPSGI